MRHTRPYFLDDSKKIISYSFNMDYLGAALDYRFDLSKAAATFARIHRMQFRRRKEVF
jgi:hypothetical protein